MSIGLQKKTIKSNVKKYFDFTFEKLEIEGYEEVYKITNDKTNLLSIISIHNTKLGSSLGGIRIKSYPNFETALEDALRLSKGMTYKSAVCEAGFGGGKSVIIVKDIKDKNEALLSSFGEAVNLLEGRYICAEDMGCSPQDMEIISKKTKYCVGLPHEKSSGNPSYFTAWGIFRGMQATLNKIYGLDTVEKRKIVIQGLGSVGMHLLEHLFWHGAELVISDIDEAKTKMLAKKFKAKAVKPDDIYKEECDIFAPCAIGAIINDKTISELKCKAICGCANNQLLEDRHATILKDKNILYAPDFVVNAGGLINVASELDQEGYNSKKARDQVHKIYDMLNDIYKISNENNISTNQAAIKLAHYKIECGIGRRKQLYFHHFE